MQREIKFRGKRLDNGEWVYGNYFIDERDIEDGFIWRDIPQIQQRYGDHYQYYDVDPSTVGQYTGLKDKNGREIYEGNIAKVTQKNNGFYMLCKIEYEPMSFILKFKNGVKSVYREGLDEEDFELEIIGDIHENPELLKEVET